MANLLITGGLGYIGGRIARHLSEIGHTVRVTSRRTSDHGPKWLPQMRVVTPDWESSDELGAVCAGIDCIIHLAAMNEVFAARDPIGALRVNGMASLRLLRAAEAAGVKRFIYFSTAHVYGAPLVGRITERTLARPQHPYAITHRVTEDFVLAAHDMKKLTGVVVRLSNAFGAPMDPDVDRWTLLVNDLCRQAATTGQMKLLSAGTQLRDFITLQDVSRAVAHLVALDASALGNGLFNVGDRTASVFEMAQRVSQRACALLNRDVPVLRPESTTPVAAPFDYLCDKLRETGFEPESRIDMEIDATLKLCLSVFGNGG